ncbi:MAG: serine hydrolase [bacterium]
MFLKKLNIFCFVLFALTVIACKKNTPTEPILQPTLPIVNTASISNITQTAAIGGGSITSDGGAPVTFRGVCWSTTTSPTIADNKTINDTGTGNFVSNITGLIENTTYYVRAYASNSAGTGYGSEISFTTLQAASSFLGLDSTKIFHLINLIQNNTYPQIHSLLIIKDDSLLIEKYFNGNSRTRTHTLQSVTKSFTSAMIGIALDKGIIESIDDKILSFFPQYTNIQNMDDWKKEIKIKDLLTMRSGTDYSEGFTNSPHDQLNSLSTGWDTFYLNRPMVSQPGTRFNYDSGGIILLSAIIKSKFGSHADVFGDQYLFPLLGISYPLWIKNAEGHPHTGGGLSLKPIDMIKLGVLYLHKGMWNGVHVVPESWVNKSFEKHVDNPYPWDPYIRGYGYNWWILKPGGKSKTNQYVYTAMGALGQYIFVIPEYNMVVAVTAGATTDDNFLNPQRFLYDYILDAVQ